MLRPEYITAIEQRLQWAKSMEEPAAPTRWTETFFGAPFDAYRYTLTHGDLYVMAPKFCELVEGARRSVPDDLAFEMPWVLSPTGWCWFSEPFLLPVLKSQVALLQAMAPLDQLASIVVDAQEGETGSLVVTRAMVEPWATELPPDQGAALRAMADQYAAGVEAPTLAIFGHAMATARQRPHHVARRLFVHAMAWYRVDDIQGPWQVRSGLDEKPDLAVLIFGGGANGRTFIPLSHFGVQHGGRLGPRVASFEAWAAVGYEKNPGRADAPYQGDPSGLRQHEIRLAYTTFHLMAQRLTVVPRVAVDRATRRRAERNKQIAPPYIEVVTLRRLEADRRRDPTGQEVEWQWRWLVSGHWRWHFCPSTGDHKRIFIESYVKGPEEKPMKAPGIKLFSAKR